MLSAATALPAEDKLQPIQYNNPGLVVDLGVGLWAWPLPMDYDRDDDLDLVVSCPDVPMSGTWFFENAEENRLPNANRRMPIFKAPVRIADKAANVQVSYIGGEPVVLTPGKIYADFRTDHYSKPIKLPLPEKIDPQYMRYRANQWKLLDWENDGDLDVIIGIGIWDDYGWDDAWDEDGNWKNGPLHGYVYLVENMTNAQSQESRAKSKQALDSQLQALSSAKFAEPRKIVTSDGNPVDVYGMPSPNFADFDGDGDLDLICGEFLDGFTWFENTGSRDEPEYEIGSRLCATKDEEPLYQFDGIRMDLQMITPVALDWDSDGDIDLICGDEDGRVAFIERLSEFERVPERVRLSLAVGSKLESPMFAEPSYFQQQAGDVKCGALATPFAVDWDHDGDEDIVCGNSAGYVILYEREDNHWKAPQYLQSYACLSATCGLCSLQDIRLQAGSQGSIQGPCEAKWGYSTLAVSDMNQDGQWDIVLNGIWGRVEYLQNSPTEDPVGWQLEARPVHVQWSESGPPKPEWTWWTPEADELATEWRTTPCVLDWNADGLNDLVMLDHEGYLAFYERVKSDPQTDDNLAGITFLPPKRIFKMTGNCEFDSRQVPVGEKKDDLLRLNAMRAGASGRRKLCFTDWDGDGRIDLLVNSVNVNFLRNVKTDAEGFTWFEDKGAVDSKRLAGHTTSPTVVDWDKNGIPDLLVGAEDGRLYHMQNPRADKATP